MRPARGLRFGYLRTYIGHHLPLLGIEAELLFIRRLLTMLAHPFSQACFWRTAAGWVVDQGEGEDALNARARRRGFATDPGWLP